MQVFRFWQTGSIGSGTWENIQMVLPFLIAGFVIAVWLIPSLNVLALGDDIAMGLGVKVIRTRALGSLATDTTAPKGTPEGLDKESRAYQHKQDPCVKRLQDLLGSQEYSKPTYQGEDWGYTLPEVQAVSA